MNRRRRYKSEDQILKAIDRAHERLTKYGLLHDCTKDAMAVLIKSGDSVSTHKETIKTCIRNMDRIKYQVLPHLGRKLSEMRTETFSFQNDRSIPV